MWCMPHRWACLFSVRSCGAPLIFVVVTPMSSVILSISYWLVHFFWVLTIEKMFLLQLMISYSSFSALSPKILVQRMRSFESRAVTGENPHSYVVGHVSAEAKLSRNISELPLKSRWRCINTVLALASWIHVGFMMKLSPITSIIFISCR